MDNLFTYGTLMCADIMEAVCGLRKLTVAGTLEGFYRRAVRGEHYPAVIAQAGQSTRGLVYNGVPDAAWVLLDRYEGEMYRRVRVKVRADAGQHLPAWAYVLRPEHQDRLADYDWDFADFLRNGKARYMDTLNGGV